MAAGNVLEHQRKCTEKRWIHCGGTWVTSRWGIRLHGTEEGCALALAGYALVPLKGSILSDVLTH